MARGKKTPFTDKMGRFHTKALFVEVANQVWEGEHGYSAPYSLKGREGYVDMHEMYIDCADPTGYAFALLAFGSWEHFEHLKTLAWFRKHLNKWEAELEVKMRSQAIKSLLDTAVNEGVKGVTAAKYLADKGWDKRRGRPSNAEVEKEKKAILGIEEEISEDAKRLGLH